MDLPLRVTVTPDRATASAGEPLVFAVSVRNVGDTVEHYALDVLGLPDGATAHSEPEVAKLRPQDVAELTVRITIPELAPAGSYVLGLVVKSKYSDQVSRCVELPVEVAVVSAMTVQAAPEVALGRFASTARARAAASSTRRPEVFPAIGAPPVDPALTRINRTARARSGFHRAGPVSASPTLGGDGLRLHERFILASTGPPRRS